jgi:hypothetical protein
MPIKLLLEVFAAGVALACFVIAIKALGELAQIDRIAKGKSRRQLAYIEEKKKPASRAS